MHFANDPMYGITFVGTGYQVRIGHPDRSFYFSRYFSFMKYENPLECAQQLRDEVIRSRKFINRTQGTRGPDNTTGFLGVSCDAKWITRDGRNEAIRIFRFTVRNENIKLSNGKSSLHTVGGITLGPWLAYRKAVLMRHRIINKRVKESIIAERYDNIFVPNYKDKLEIICLDWRRIHEQTN